MATRCNADPAILGALLILHGAVGLILMLGAVISARWCWADRSLVMTSVACYLPARRAARVAPVAAITPD